MIKITLVLLYMMNGELTLERNRTFDTSEACAKAGSARVQELAKNPKFDHGLFAGCLPVMQPQEVRK